MRPRHPDTRISRRRQTSRTFGFAVEELPTEKLPFPHHGSFLYAHQAKFHPLKYLEAIRNAAEKLGVKFFDHSEALSIDGDETVVVKTASGSVTATFVIQATYQPFENPWSLFAMKGMYKSYVYELSVPGNVFPEGLYLDDQNPYHYVRIDKNGDRDRMIVGGEDHRWELPIDEGRSFNGLLAYVDKQFPGLVYDIVCKWAGPILESIDGLPFIGRYDAKCPNRFVATAFSGNGMTYAHIAAEILTDEINGKKSAYSDLYDPLRQKISPSELVIKTRDYVGEAKAYVRNLFRPKNAKRSSK